MSAELTWFKSSYSGDEGGNCHPDEHQPGVTGVHQRAEHHRRDDATEVEAGGDEAEHLAERTLRRGRAHDHVA